MARQDKKSFVADILAILASSVPEQSGLITTVLRHAICNLRRDVVPLSNEQVIQMSGTQAATILSSTRVKPSQCKLPNAWRLLHCGLHLLRGPDVASEDADATREFLAWQVTC